MEQVNRKKTLVHSRCTGGNSSRTKVVRLDREMNCVLHSELEITRDHQPPVSDSESSTTTSTATKPDLFTGDGGLVTLQEGQKGFQIIKNAFLSGMAAFANHTNVVSIHKNWFSSLSGQAKIQAFRIYSEAVSKKCGGNGNVKFAWFGTSRDQVDNIITYGFNHCGKQGSNGLYGSAICLSPHGFSLDSAMSAPVDENGLRHVLLCRVILGNLEEVPVGSPQFCPSSVDFDCGVDNMMSPKKYVVWTSHMNTHILPEYVMSFKAPPCLNVTQEPLAKPKSPWMPFPMLISVLSKFLPPSTLSLIKKCHADYQEKKISRQHLIQQVRVIAGDKLLISVIKSFRGKQLKATTGSPMGVNGGLY